MTLQSFLYIGWVLRDQRGHRVSRTNEEIV
jgi:hypothetical protein